MLLGHWILDEKGNRCPEPDLLVWAEWFEHGNLRRVAWTEINPRLRVSTVFLGLDHNFTHTGPPLLWETMVFRDGQGDDMRRYSSQAAARAGHEVMVKRWRRRWRWRWVLDPWEWLDRHRERAGWRIAGLARRWKHRLISD